MLVWENLPPNVEISENYYYNKIGSCNEAGIHSRKQRYRPAAEGNGYRYEDFCVALGELALKAEKQALEVLGENDKD
jgi:hypothetical protein